MEFANELDMRYGIKNDYKGLGYNWKEVIIYQSVGTTGGDTWRNEDHKYDVGTKI